MLKTVLITGANSGLGKEAARQLALLNSTEKIYLGVRSLQKGEVAKQELEQETGRSIFELFLADVSNVESVRTAVNSITEPIDGLVMNAGGMGGSNPSQKTSEGATQLFAVNVLGHVVLLEELLKAGKLTQVAVYAGSEAARGVPMMGMKRPSLNTSSVDEFTSIIDGSFFGNEFDAMQAYGPVKYMAALWMSSLAKQYPDVRFVTMSPGGTSGTNIMEDLPPVMAFMFKAFGTTLMPLMGMMHPVDVGAKRYVDALTDSSFESGVFYASKRGATGPVVDQGTIFADLNNPAFQSNAHQAIHQFLN